MANEEYLANILKWRKEVDANLRRENSWLALAALFWLRKGTNLIGSDRKKTIWMPPSRRAKPIQGIIRREKRKGRREKGEMRIPPMNEGIASPLGFDPEP